LFARRLALAALALIPLLHTTPVLAAEENPAFGYAIGTDPRTWQYSSAMHFRHHPWGEYSDTLFSLITRSQQISQDKRTAFESFGLGTTVGAKWWFLRGGLGLELAWAKRLSADPAGNLSYNNSPAFLVEPYVGAELPFLKTDFTELDVRLHWPVYSTDALIGPRVMLTLWVGGGVDTEEEEYDEEEEETDEEPTEEDEEEMDEEEEEAAPAPAPSKPQSAPKAPAAPTAPKAPAAPKSPAPKKK
jgi:hypothetical protein